MEIRIMGSDQRSVRCARVSFGKDETTDPTRDKKLIRYLFKHKHASPFEHNIVAFECSKKEWLNLMEKANNPTVQIYHSGYYCWMNLRNAINVYHILPEQVRDKLREHFPTTLPVVESGGTIDDKELEGLPYSTDKVFLQERIETSSGWIGLVDKLEINTDMDYYTFIVECPLFVARQWHRHRFGSYNEISRRYTAYDIKFYIPSVLRKQAKSNKQASLEEPVDEPFHGEFVKEIERIVHESLELYERMTKKEVAKELARGILPQFMKTRYYWTVPRISLDNFITLRTHEGAQKEIREFAEAIIQLVGYRGTDKRNIL